MGTIIFSSCQFLRFMDAIPIIARYAASALVCRFINTYELRGMNAKLMVEVWDHDTQHNTVIATGVPAGDTSRTVSHHQTPRDQSSGNLSKNSESQLKQHVATKDAGAGDAYSEIASKIRG
jgi:hypothetical protein